MHIKIGTRKSKLALWQANHVAEKLQAKGYNIELVHILSEGDKVLDTPLPLMGGKGVFTKALDDALLNGEIDIAVHSFKDIPTELPEGIALGAVLERENPADVIVCRNGIDFLNTETAIIATSSNRRKSQWLQRYPNHQIVDIRGNVDTRIQKLKDSNWDAAIFAAAGLIRLELEYEITQSLDWMLHAPGQGAVAVVYPEGDEAIFTALQYLHHLETAACTLAERDFLNELSGGCSAPVGAEVHIEGGEMYFHGIVLDTEGKEKIEIELSKSLEEAKGIGREAAQLALAQGADELITASKND
ncbi:MAG: hydroxymethylbilane synthase [Flavobacteriales bacterium]|nr:hydroxymethylbilane synthase [Flavobacteriales bacterium]|tara:strand:+ start:4708 stop:5613 length:906 start_codon:yes stop_codon:yes gene_type:complete